MKSSEVIQSLSKIEQDIKQLRMANFQARWFVCALKGLEEHAKGLRFAVESIVEMTKKISKKEQ